MARQPREASAADVRQWALDTNWTDSGGNSVGERGRFSSELVEAFNKVHKKNNVQYQGGGVSGGNTAGNSRSAQVATRTPARSSNSSPATRRAPSGPTRQTETPAPRQRRQSSSGDVAAAVIMPSGSGLSNEQMEQFNRMLADANAVTGTQNELTIIRIAPAQVA